MNLHNRIYTFIEHNYIKAQPIPACRTQLCAHVTVLCRLGSIPHLPLRPHWGLAHICCVVCKGACAERPDHGGLLLRVNKTAHRHSKCSIHITRRTDWPPKNQLGRRQLVLHSDTVIMQPICCPHLMVGGTLTRTHVPCFSLVASVVYSHREPR